MAESVRDLEEDDSSHAATSSSVVASGHSVIDLAALDLQGWETLGLPLPELTPYATVRSGVSGGEPNIAYRWFVPNAAVSPVTLLLCHGAGHAKWCMEFLARRIVNCGIAVLTVDLPGHGWSSGTGQGGNSPTQVVFSQSADDQLATVRGYTLDDYGTSLCQVVDALGIDSRRVVLAGHSMGGATVQLAAAQREWAGVLVLCMPSWKRESEMGEMVFLITRNPKAFFGMLSAKGKPIARAMIETYFFSNTSKTHRASPEMVSWLSGHLQVETPAFIETLSKASAIYKKQLSRGLQGLPPVHFVRGEFDNLSSPASIRKSARDFANATVVTLPGLPHNAMLPITSNPNGWEQVADVFVSFATGLAADHSDKLCVSARSN